VETTETVDPDTDTPRPLPWTPPVDNRAALEGILFVVRIGIRWNDLPTTAFGVSGATCWRRLKEWHDAGVWQRLHETLLAELRSAGLLDLAHTVVDSSHLRALKGGPHRSQPGRPGPAGQQAPLDHRRHRHPWR
jgi:transposase